MSSCRKSEPFRLCIYGVRILALTFVAALLSPIILRAQEVTAAPSEEIVVNLAAGRVIIAVVKDAIIIATIENPIETQTHPPIPVPVSNRRAGVLLGAIDWFSLSSQVELARLDRELPHLRSHVAPPNAGTVPGLSSSDGQSEATDLEAVGQGVLE